MNVSKSKPLRLKRLFNDANKKKSVKTHSKNFNRQYFGSWDYIALFDRSSPTTYSPRGSEFFLIFLTIIILYTCLTYFLGQVASMFFYDIWDSVNTILSQSQASLSSITTQEDNLIEYLDELSKDSRLNKRFSNTFSLTKILSFITVS
jgi:hypothetical protein